MIIFVLFRKQCLLDIPFFLSSSLLLGSMQPRARFLPTIPSCVSPQCQCRPSSCCCCRLACPRCCCCCCYVTPFQYFKMAGQYCQAFDLQFRQISGRKLLTLSRIWFSAGVGTVASQLLSMVSTVLSSFLWVKRKMCLPSDFPLHQHQQANCH